MEPPPDDSGGVAPAAADVEDMLPQAGLPSQVSTKIVGKRKRRRSHSGTSTTSGSASALESHSTNKRRKISQGAAASHSTASSDIPPPIHQPGPPGSPLHNPDRAAFGRPTLPSSRSNPGSSSTSLFYGNVTTSPLPQQTISYSGTIIIDKADASIEEGRRVSKLHEPDGQIYMFTDASTQPEGTGIGVVYRYDTRTDKWAEILQTLPEIDDVNFAEAKVLVVGIRFFIMDFGGDTSIKGLTVLLDSAKVLITLMKYDVDGRFDDSPKELETHVRQIHEATEKVVMMGKTVTLRWVKAHGVGKKRVEGNARADELAKSARPRNVAGKKDKMAGLIRRTYGIAQKIKEGK